MKILIISLFLFLNILNAATLQSAYDSAKSGEGYNKLIILNKDSIYTGGFTQNVQMVCIHGNGAIIKLEGDTIKVTGPSRRIDIDHCVFLVNQNAGSAVYLNNAVSTSIINNTFWNINDGNNFRTCLYFKDCQANPIVLQNNIFAHFYIGVFISVYQSDPGNLLISNYDMWDCQTSYMFMGNWTGFPKSFKPYPGNQELLSYPEFIDTTNYNFALNSSSPCIDYGHIAGFSYSGNAPDLGALESLFSKFIGTNVSGEISEDFTKDKSPYIITGDITIPSGKVIKIYPGVTFKINAGRSIKVYGRLICAGEKNDSVYFLNNSAYDISWGRIDFYPNSSDSSCINYAVLKQGSHNYLNSAAGIIICNSNYISINNSFFNNGFSAIYCGENSRVDIRNNIFFEKVIYSGIRDVNCAKNSEVNLVNNIFYCSGVFCDSAKLNAVGNKFMGQDYNLDQTYWLIYLTKNSSAYLESNKMQNNYGAVLADNSTIKSYNDLISSCNNAYFLNQNSSGIICNNTIYLNTDGVGFGVTTAVNSNVDVMNSIIWITGSQWNYSLKNYDSSTINAKYCLLSQEYTGDHLIYKNPIFADTANNNFHLLYQSPALDAGTPDTVGLDFPAFDLDGNQRIANNRIDIGCYEGYIFYDNANGSNKTLLGQYELMQNYPNPFNPSTTISFDIPVASHVKLLIYDILGREIKTLVDKVKSPGKYKISWNASGLADGIYLYSLKAGNYSETKKLVLLK